MSKPLIRHRKNRLVYRDRQHLHRFLFIVWLLSYIVLIGGTSVLLYDVFIVGQDSVYQGKGLGNATVAMLFWTLFPLVFFGGFVVDLGAGLAWRLRIPLLPVRRFPINTAQYLGIRDYIKLYRAANGGIDKVHNYTLTFRRGDGSEEELYATQKHDRALRLQSELAELMQIQTLPVVEMDIPNR